MGVLMIFHCINFKQGKLLRRSREGKEDEHAEYASIMPDEYHFFTDQEIEAHSLADRSSRAIDDSEKVDSELAKSAGRPTGIMLNASAIS